jgi:hypothetical protein
MKFLLRNAMKKSYICSSSITFEIALPIHQVNGIWILGLSIIPTTIREKIKIKHGRNSEIVIIQETILITVKISKQPFNYIVKRHE